MMIWRSDDLMIWWSDDLMIWWYDDMMIWWFDDLMIRWYDDTMMMVMVMMMMIMIWSWSDDDLMIWWYLYKDTWGMNLTLIEFVDTVTCFEDGMIGAHFSHRKQCEWNVKIRMLLTSPTLQEMGQPLHGGETTWKQRADGRWTDSFGSSNLIFRGEWIGFFGQTWWKYSKLMSHEIGFPSMSKKRCLFYHFFPGISLILKKMQITNAQAADGPLTVLVIGCPSVAGVSDDNRLDMHRTWTQLWTITDHNQRNRYFGFRNLKIDVSTMIFRGVFRRWSRLFRVSACPWPHSAGPDDFVDLLEIIDVYAASGSGCDAVDELLRKVRHVCLLEKRIKYKIN